MDQARVDCLQRRCVDAQTLGHAGTEALDGDVALGCQAMGESAAFGLLEVDDHAALVAVDAEEDGAELVFLERRPAAGFVAQAEGFDLDDVRAEIAQRLRAERAGENAREIQHLDA